MTPYTFHDVHAEDVGAVVRVLGRAERDGIDAERYASRLTQGPEVDLFEDELAEHTGGHVVACNSGTAALHLALAALGVGDPMHEVIVPALTFVATAAAVHYAGARVVLADVDPATGLMGSEHLAARLTPRTVAVIGVDYAGRPCDYAALRSTCEDHLPGRRVALVADACHALGATSLATHPDLDAACYSFHPAKHVACGEGGAVAFRRMAHAVGAAALRNHGRLSSGAWCDRLGHNYRLPELSAALGRSQLTRLDIGIAHRRWLAATYDVELADAPVRQLYIGEGAHAHHLYVVRCPTRTDRARFQEALASSGYGTQVHYQPLTRHPVVGRGQPSCLGAEEAGVTYLTLPLHMGVTEQDARRVAEVIVEEVRTW